MHGYEEQQYLNVAQRIQKHGLVRNNERTGVGTKSIFANQMAFDLFNRRLPIVSTRKIKPMDPIIEMLWFIAGDTDVEFLIKHNINIWNDWVIESTKRFDESSKLIGGSIGSGAYGKQWRAWEDTRIVDIANLERYRSFGYNLVCLLNSVQYPGGEKKCVIRREIDQLAAAIDQIKHNPESRRIIVSAWNPGQFEDMALLPCHNFHQYFVADMDYSEIVQMLEFQHEYRQANDMALAALDRLFESRLSLAHVAPSEVMAVVEKGGFPTKKLFMMLNIRSSDWLVGGAYNIEQYGALCHMVAQVTNTWASSLIVNTGDTHVYSNQFDGFDIQKEREPLGNRIVLKIDPAVADIDSFTPQSFEVLGYKHLDFIKYPIAV